MDQTGMFTQENTAGYTDAQLAQMNEELSRRLDVALEKRDVDESYGKFIAEGVQRDFDSGKLGPTLPAFPLVIEDSGHWGTVKLDGEPLFSVYLDGDSIEGKRSPDAEKRLQWLALFAGAWADRDNDTTISPVPIVRTYQKAGGFDAG